MLENDDAKMGYVVARMMRPLGGNPIIVKLDTNVLVDTYDHGKIIVQQNIFKIYSIKLFL